jgi:hypothetical protein
VPARHGGGSVSRGEQDECGGGAKATLAGAAVPLADRPSGGGPKGVHPSTRDRQGSGRETATGNRTRGAAGRRAFQSRFCEPSGAGRRVRPGRHGHAGNRHARTLAHGRRGGRRAASLTRAHLSAAQAGRRATPSLRRATARVGCGEMAAAASSAVWAQACGVCARRPLASLWRGCTTPG